MHIGFMVEDLVGNRAMVCDELNGDYYGPHNNLAIKYTTFVFDPASPSILIIKNMLDTMHIKFTEERWH